MNRYTRISQSSLRIPSSEHSRRQHESGSTSKSSRRDDVYGNLDADKLLEEIGQCGLYQVLAYMLCQLLNFFYSASMFIMPFIQLKPNFTCDLANKFDLLSSNPVIQEAGFCVFSLGAMVVVPFVSQLADLYGRRITLLVTLYLSVLFNILAAFAPNYIAFVILRFFVGATSDSYLTIGSILSCEVVANESRPWTGLIGTLTWLLGYLYTGLLTRFIYTWRELYLAMALPGLITIVYIFINRQTVDLSKCRVESQIAMRSQRVKKRTFWDILTWKRILFHVFTNGFITMLMAFYYFAISLDSINLSDDKFTGFMLSGAIELPGGLFALPLLHFFGRRSVTVFSLVLQGITTSISPFVRRWQWARMTCDLSAKMINGVGSVSHPLLVNEMMPTTIRTISYSIINIPQSVGIMLSPLLKYTDMGDGKIPCLTLAIFSFVSALLAMTLPETKDKPMPEDFDQMDVGPLLERFIGQPVGTEIVTASSSSTK